MTKQTGKMQLDKVYNIDFLDNSLPNKCARLIIADPPYYRTKGTFDFIWKTMDEYLIDVEKWAVECKRLLADNGTLFWWGHAKKIAYSQMILDKYFNLENVIKWRKIDCQTQKGIKDYNVFAPVSEHVLMYGLDSIKLGLEMIHDRPDCFLPIKQYMRDQRVELIKEKGFKGFAEFNRFIEELTKSFVVSRHYFSDSQWMFPVVHHYRKIQETGFWQKDYKVLKQEYDELRTEYEPMRLEYEALRRPFDNYMKLTDVWDFTQESHISKNYAHETQKTESISRIIINTCSKVGDLVVVPFAGSGTEVSMAIKEGRKAIAFDIEQSYVDMSNNRIGKILQKPQLF